jgi:hypothetical protein
MGRCYRVVRFIILGLEHITVEEKAQRGEKK